MKAATTKPAAMKGSVATQPMKGNVAKANGNAGSRTKVMPNRITGKVKDWKGAFGWIEADQSISHPEAKKNGGKIYLAHEDVEEELSGIGARVSFFVYTDGKGLGAMNVKKAGAKSTSLPPNKVAGTAATKPKLGGMATSLKASAKKAAAKSAPAANLKRKRLTSEPVMGEIVQFKGKIGWIKPSESIDGIDDKDLYCTKADVVEGTPTAKGTDVEFHIYKDAKGFGADGIASNFLSAGILRPRRAGLNEQFGPLHSGECLGASVWMQLHLKT